MGSDHPEKDHDEGFAEAMGDVKPLKQRDTAEPYSRRPPPRPLPRECEVDSGDDLADMAVETGLFLEFRRPGVQNRLYRDLQRGVLEPEATLDLHGMRVVDARGAMARFLSRSTGANKRCVRIIHGKGRGTGDGPPVLKHKTNQWLRQREEVLAFCSAPRWDGGTGAVYVLLRRVWDSPGRRHR